MRVVVDVWRGVWGGGGGGGVCVCMCVCVRARVRVTIQSTEWTGGQRFDEQAKSIDGGGGLMRKTAG